MSSKSAKNEFENRAAAGTEAEKVEKLSPFFFSIPLITKSAEECNEVVRLATKGWTVIAKVFHLFD